MGVPPPPGVLMVNLNYFFVDINECVRDQISDEYQHLEHNCHVDANCTNTKGSFYCNCLKGFSGDGVTCVGRSDLDVAK